MTMKSTMTCWVMALFAMTGWAGINNPPVAGSAGLLATNGSASGLTGYSLGVPVVATGAAQAVVAPWTNQVTAASIAAAGGVTGTPWKVDATNIATAIHTYDKTNLVTVLGVSVGTTNTYTIDPTISDRFYIDTPSNGLNEVSFPTTGYDMQSLIVVLPSLGFTNQLTGSVDFGGIAGVDLIGSAGEVIYIGLRKRPFSNLWDVVGVSKGYGL